MRSRRGVSLGRMRGGWSKKLSKISLCITDSSCEEQGDVFLSILKQAVNLVTHHHQVQYREVEPMKMVGLVWVLAYND